MACGTGQAKAVLIPYGELHVNLQEQNRQNKSLSWLHLSRTTVSVLKLRELLFDQGTESQTLLLPISYC